MGNYFVTGVGVTVVNDNFAESWSQSPDGVFLNFQMYYFISIFEDTHNAEHLYLVKQGIIAGIVVAVHS